MFRRIVLVLGSLHLSIMASLGIWLWRNPGLFGSKNTCAQATTVIIGHPVPLTSGTLRFWSIVIYSLFLAPGFNLVLPMGLFLGLFLFYQRRHRGGDAQSHSRRIPPSIAPTVLGLALLVMLNLVFLLDIELTLRENRRRQATGESTWAFGQILAMLLLVLPLRDLLETLSERRETDRKKQLAHTLKIYIHKQAQMKEILDLVEDGADVNAVVEDSECEYATALQVASSRPDEAFITALLNYGADPNMLGARFYRCHNID
ncbi:hypothetical protein C8R45DRAFT_44248 [Mycena sanguinolenta]|nr:hypothetical protein C8R45DRAFT_44248 [Mycena sanguinolenta]